MFERYTDPARRAIFFARYEAASRLSYAIEAQHLVMGVLREDAKLLALFLTPEVLARMETNFPVTQSSVNTYSIRTPIHLNIRKKSWVPDWLFNTLIHVDAKEGDELRDREWLRRFVRDQETLNANLPLDNECKRILAYAAEEAERLNHRHIGNLHLLLGVLRNGEGGSAALKACGIELEALRKAARTHG